MHYPGDIVLNLQSKALEVIWLLQMPSTLRPYTSIDSQSVCRNQNTVRHLTGQDRPEYDTLGRLNQMDVCS